MKLTDIPVGNSAIIKHLSSKDALRERMLALGITKGTKVDVIRKGPTGDPTVYIIKGAMIALRKEEAALIHVFD